MSQSKKMNQEYANEKIVRLLTSIRTDAVLLQSDYERMLNSFNTLPEDTQTEIITLLIISLDSLIKAQHTFAKVTLLYFK